MSTLLKLCIEIYNRLKCIIQCSAKLPAIHYIDLVRNSDCGDGQHLRTYNQSNSVTYSHQSRPI